MRCAVCFALFVFLRITWSQVRIEPLLTLDGKTRESVVSPDGSTLAFVWSHPDYSSGLYTRPLAGGEARLLVAESQGGSPYRPSWSPDGKRISFSRFYSHWDNHLFVRDLATQQEHDFGLVCDHATRSSWSADGGLLLASLYAENPPRSFACRPALLSSATGARVRWIAERGEEAQFSPDGRAVAYADGGALMLLRLTADYQPSGTARELAREPRTISEIHWTPDGQEIVYEGWGDVSYFRRIKLMPGSRAEPVPGLDDVVSIDQILPDGRALATQAITHEALWRLDLQAERAKTEKVSDDPCFAGVPGCSADGKFRVFLSAKTGLFEIWRANADGSGARSLAKSIPGFTDPKDDGATDLKPGWSPDGKWIAFTVFPSHGNADTRAYLYAVPSSGGTPRRLGAEAYALYGAVWSPDGGSLIAAQSWNVEDRSHDHDYPVVRVNLASGLISRLGAEGTNPGVSADGKFLYFFGPVGRGFFRRPMAGGPPESLIEGNRREFGRWVLGKRYLYLLDNKSTINSRLYAVSRLDPESKEAVELTEIPFHPHVAYVSPDERWLYLKQQDDPKDRVVLVRGLIATESQKTKK